MDTIKFNKTQDWTIFILRRIDENMVETDTMLGGFYSYIQENKSTDVFNECTLGWSDEDKQDVYAVITFFDTSVMPLYKNSTYYIMTDTGGTVANRSFKG